MAAFNHLTRSFPTIVRRGATKFRMAALAGLAVLGCDTDDQTKSYDFEQSTVGLHAFEGCDELSAYFRVEALALLDELGSGGGYGRLGGGEDLAFAPETDGTPTDQGNGAGGDDFSRTNTQEADVDEPDLVKTDGRWIYLVRNGYVLIYDASDLALLSKVEAPSYDATLMLHDDRLLVIGSTWGESDRDQVGEGGPQTTAVIYDVTDREAPREVRRVTVQGLIAAARAAKGTARLAIQFDATETLAARLPQSEGQTPRVTEPAFDGEDRSSDTPAPKTDEAADWQAAARKLVAETKASDWLPQMRDSATGKEGLAVQCRGMYRPGERAGLTVTAIISLSLDDPQATVAHAGVVSGAGVVYMSADNLYLTSGNHFGMGGVGVGGVAGGDVAVANPSPGEAVIVSPLAVDDRQATQVHRLAIGDAQAAPVYRGTARVHGAPLDQFSMSDFKGHLRVATTEQSFANDELRQSNNVTVVDNTTMEVTGSVEGLAEGERIYATRMMGERGFVVTFRQVDPLFTLDLTDPRDPKVVGELKVPGFSTYLHPLGADHLIGIGRSATDEGFDTGLQLSLFDVSKFEAPTLAHAHHFGEAWSDAQYDHHAFTYWGDRSLLFIPVSAWDAEGDHSTAVEVFKVTVDGGFAPAGHIEHPAAEWTSVQRSVVIGDMVFTITQEDMQATGLDGMQGAGHVRFPAAPNRPEGDRDDGDRDVGGPESFEAEGGS